MIRLASAPTPNLKLLARSALTMLSSPPLMKESKCELPATSAAALDVLRDWAKGDGQGTDGVHLGPILERQPEPETPDHPLDVAVADWDILFRAVKIRLMLSVSEKLPLTVPPAQAAEAAELVQSTVLECVDSLNQLHQALTHERGRRDPSAAIAPSMQLTQPAALV